MCNLIKIDLKTIRNNKKVSKTNSSIQGRVKKIKILMSIETLIKLAIFTQRQM